MNVRSPRRAYLPSPFLDLCGSVKQKMMNDVFLPSCDHWHHYTLSRIWEGVWGWGEGGIISAELILSIHAECVLKDIMVCLSLISACPNGKISFLGIAVLKYDV